MSTEANNPDTPPVNAPANPAKGNLRGQTTLAARIARIEVLVDNLAPHIDETPALKDQYLQLQSMLASAKTLRNRLKTLRSMTADALTQRNQMLVEGEDIFERVRLGLLSFHGPKSDRLLEFGLKPRRSRSGRPRKTQTTPVEPPQVEFKAGPTTSGSSGSTGGLETKPPAPQP